MTNEERNEEGAEEAVEDLEAPADAQADVAGGADTTCGSPSMQCVTPTCMATRAYCRNRPATSDIVAMEQ
jgi:hypothetical protein